VTRRLLTGAVIVALLAGAGCGGDSGDGRLLTNGEASELRGTLRQVEQEVADGDCTSAAQDVAKLQGQIDSIRRLDRKLRRALRSSARRLETLVSTDCETPTTTTPTETTPTTPEEGTTGATGATGTTGEEGKSEKKEKEKEKEKKVPPGQEKKRSGESGGEGGAVLPGEDTSGGGETP
jgi:hypothetical protein